MNLNQTTRHTAPPGPQPGFIFFFALIPFLLLALLVCIAVVVACLRRRSRSDDLRHRLIPLYRYDPTEDLGLGDCEEEELAHKTDSCVNTTSRCPPTQRCSSSRGHYGLVHVLSAQGCMDVALCGSYEILSFKGTDFNVSHTCCCKDKCNTPPKTGPNMELLLGMITEKEYSDIRNVLQEEFWDSCANYI
ncbi:hypothetical protein fugu_011530 [Takifugu bimaculatus]|uniref:UPAR/Ly6 domain-containing protein n=1 Tax=Takifugu bimaculatus TaxID=433685 RepID=A0A4Z2C800_9TELE|nr:hypothetical protein fugu_011530 [Takifugu bimaculatus]